MKTLYLNRHAKSSWNDSELSDFERPLNNRGERDAPLMANILCEKVKAPQLIYSSPANRAITTAKQFAKSFKYDENEIISDEIIYGAGVSDIMRLIYKTSNKLDTIMFFGHNPTFTTLSNYLSDKNIVNMPTCGFVQINFNLDSWNDIEGKTGMLILFEYPKKYLS